MKEGTVCDRLQYSSYEQNHEKPWLGWLASQEISIPGTLNTSQMNHSLIQLVRWRNRTQSPAEMAGEKAVTPSNELL